METTFQTIQMQPEFPKGAQFALLTRDGKICAFYKVENNKLFFQSDFPTWRGSEHDTLEHFISFHGSELIAKIDTGIFKSELLQKLADDLKTDGLRIFYSPSDDRRKPTYFFFTDGINIGYAQEGYYGGITFSTVHKPCQECGTGFRITDDPGTYEPTIKDAKKAFIMYPDWAKQKDRAAVKKYVNIEEWLSKQTILKYVEY